MVMVLHQKMLQGPLWQDKDYMSVLAGFSAKDLDKLYKQHFPQQRSPSPTPSTPPLAPTLKRRCQSDEASPEKITSHINYRSYKKSCLGVMLPMSTTQVTLG